MANIITLSRIPLAAAMLISKPFSSLFWAFYGLAAASDIADGIAARRFACQSEAGAKLDSIADAAFAATIAAVMIINVALPAWLWLAAAGTALVRISGYAVGFLKFRTFAALHTYANKAAGALLAAAPVLFSLAGLTFTGILLAAAAFLSALEEAAILIKSRNLNRNCRGLIELKKEKRGRE